MKRTNTIIICILSIFQMPHCTKPSKVLTKEGCSWDVTHTFNGIVDSGFNMVFNKDGSGEETIDSKPYRNFWWEYEWTNRSRGLTSTFIHVRENFTMVVSEA